MWEQNAVWEIKRSKMSLKVINAVNSYKKVQTGGWKEQKGVAVWKETWYCEK